MWRARRWLFAIDVSEGGSVTAIKRIVGLPGDRIACHDGRLYRDDRAVSVDSRQWGPIAQDRMIGRLVTTLR